MGCVCTTTYNDCKLKIVSGFVNNYGYSSDSVIMLFRGHNDNMFIVTTNIKFSNENNTWSAIMKYINEGTYCDVVLKKANFCSPYDYEIVDITPSNMIRVGKVVKISGSYIKNYVIIEFSDGEYALSETIMQLGITYEYKYTYNRGDFMIITSFIEKHDNYYESDKLLN
jgi:hypothetical protein